MRRTSFVLLGVLTGMTVAGLPACLAAAAKDRACTQADIKRFEAMIVPNKVIKAGDYVTDPFRQITTHYLGTVVKDGVCNVQLKPVE